MPADLGGMCVQWVGAALCGEEQPLPCHQGLLLDPDGVEIRGLQELRGRSSSLKGLRGPREPGGMLPPSAQSWESLVLIEH